MWNSAKINFYNCACGFYLMVCFRCTIIYGTPTMYVDLVNLQKREPVDVNLKVAVTGGASCSPGLFRDMQKYLKVERVKVC